MRGLPAPLLLCGLLLAGCLGGSGGDGPAADATTTPHPAARDLGLPAGTFAMGPAPDDPAAIRFIALGDTGTGDAGQRAVARAVESVCQARGCDFAVDLGDLVYESGVSGPDDPQFDAKFEEPYANLTLPFFNVLGNHDNSGGPAGGDGGLGAWYESGNHQVAYAQRADRASPKWQMPARHYSFRVGPAEFFALDTNTLVYQGLSVPPPSDLQLEVRDQEAWLDRALAASDAPWRFTLGHHPYVSNGQHGDAGAYDGLAGAPGLSGDYVKSFYEAHACGRVDVILAGHDHDLQWLQPVPTCGATEFIVSGAGAKTRPLAAATDDAFFGAGDTLGFLWIEVAGDTFHGVVYGVDAAGGASVLFERILERT